MLNVERPCERVTVRRIDSSCECLRDVQLQVYMHQSSQYLVRRLDLERGEALVEPANKINYYTESKELTEISILEQLKMATVGATQVCQGKVRVAAKVSHFELVVNCALGLVWPRFCPAFCTLFQDRAWVTSP